MLSTHSKIQFANSKLKCSKYTSVPIHHDKTIWKLGLNTLDNFNCLFSS